MRTERVANMKANPGGGVAPRFVMLFTFVIVSMVGHICAFLHIMRNHVFLSASDPRCCLGGGHQPVIFVRHVLFPDFDT